MLEHAYGASFLSALLLQRPVDGLGDDVTPTEVRFQQAARYPVDDLVVVGRCGTGTRMMFVGVRRNPTVAGGSPPFVQLMAEYLHMLVDHRAEFDDGRWRLGLAVAGPHVASQQVKVLAELARRQRDNAEFRAAVAAPRATNGKIRARLRHLDAVVAAAAARAGVELADDADRDELTWRLLRALHIIALRLEGDDAADRSHHVAALMPFTRDAASADNVWRRLVELSAGYAQTAATVDLDVVRRDLGTCIRIGPPNLASPTHGGDEENFRARLAELPPAHTPRLLDAWRVDPAGTWRLVAALTSMQDRPIAVVREWAQHRPTWLTQACWQLQVAAGELANSYNGRRLAADLFVAAADQGASRREFWLARAALWYDEVEEAERCAQALTRLGPIGGVVHSYARAVVTLMGGDPEAASRELNCWSPEVPIDTFIRAGLQLRLAVVRDGELLTCAGLDRGLDVLSDALRQEWSAGLAIAKARLLIERVRRAESANRYADLREARELAIRARNDRRTYRGDSTEPTELACQAAFLSDDLRIAVALGTVTDNGATTEEAASSVVREYVAVAACQLGEHLLARQTAHDITNPAAKTRVEALLAEVEGADPRPHWRRAIELARDNDEHLGRALVGLAASGAEELPRLDEFAQRQPAAAAEIRAIRELTAGNPGAAITQLRAHRRTSMGAALGLAQAYRTVGNVDDQVRTLLDAASDFRDPSLQGTAAEALIQADRPAEAQRVLDALLASTAPDWSGRADALRLAAQLACNDRRHDRACELLATALQLEPDHADTRWALIRLLIYRGDIDQAWRVLSAQPLEPANVADARIWIQLHRRKAPIQQTVEGCLRLLRRFADSEEFNAFVVTNLIAPGAPVHELPDNLLADMRLETQRFFDRWPDSQHLRRLDTSDIAQLIAAMNQEVRPSEEQQLELQRLAHQLHRGQVPISLLAAAAKRSYAETVILRPVGVQPARHPDGAEHRVCVDVARSAADHDIAIDTTAIATLIALPDDIRQAATAMFARVITTDETLLDALNSKDALALRSTDTWIHDDQLNSGRFVSITKAEADRLAHEAASLHAAVAAIARFPRPAIDRADDPDAPALITWISVADLAKDRQVAVWSDDPILRAQARQEGLSATSTPAILQELMRRSELTAAQHEDAVRALIKARIGDFPLHVQRLLELAEDDGWAPGCVAAALGRPGAWTDMTRAADLYYRLIALVRSHRPDSIPDWLRLAVRGATATASQPTGRTDITARLLTLTIHRTSAQGQAANSLVTVARTALGQTDDADQPPSPDPLPGCALLLRDSYAKIIPHSLATQYAIATFATLAEPDKQVVVRTLLR